MNDDKKVMPTTIQKALAIIGAVGAVAGTSACAAEEVAPDQSCENAAETNDVASEQAPVEGAGDAKPEVAGEPKVLRVTHTCVRNSEMRPLNQPVLGVHIVLGG